jgi:DNA polymerase III gamma/tau subunit
LYLRYRPAKFSDVIGQKEAIQTLTAMGKQNEIPHTLMFTGPSGCGKTTLARIVAAKLKCSGPDLQEVNAADFRGIEAVRDIRGRVGASPLMGDCRIWIFDECQSLTSDAQDALLKLLEDTPRHVYFFLATTDPQKLKTTIKTRCTEIKCTSIKVDDLKGLVRKVLAAEQLTLSDAIVNRIADAADGSARKALVLLHQVCRLPDQNAQLAACDKADPQREGIELARMLCSTSTKWSAVANVLRGLEGDPEGIRRLILAYSSKILINKPDGDDRLATIGDEFRETFFYTGEAGLRFACYNVIFSK